MLYTDTRLGTARYDDWLLEFSETIGADGTYLCHGVELSRDGRRLAKLSLLRPGLRHDEAVRQLHQRAAVWIEDYKSRPHTGDTGMGAGEE